MEKFADKLEFGIWPDGRYVTFWESNKKPNGCIDEMHICGSFGSQEDAEMACAQANAEVDRAVSARAALSAAKK